MNKWIPDLAKNSKKAKCSILDGNKHMELYIHFHVKRCNYLTVNNTEVIKCNLNVFCIFQSEKSLHRLCFIRRAVWLVYLPFIPVSLEIPEWFGIKQRFIGEGLWLFLSQHYLLYSLLTLWDLYTSVKAAKSPEVTEIQFE